LYKRYTRVFGVSRFITDHLRDQGCSADLYTRLHVLNTKRFQPDTNVRDVIRQQYDAGQTFVVVVVGYLVRAKGVDVAIRAMAHLPPSVKLWVIGGGEESGVLQNLCQELGLTERVRFFGHQPDVQRFLQAADCFVCPSRWGEAAGLVNLEAQSSGLPAIASRIGGIPEYIQDGQTGFVFTPGDDRDLAEKIRLLYDDPGLCQAMQRSARNWVLEHFSSENCLDDFLNLYRVSRKQI
jgi:glycosyltransferase involved in cell wall biosynthesis